MHLLYKKVEAELDIRFASLYLEFAQSDNYTIRLIIAKSLHEAFKLVLPEEDISDLSRCFMNFILGENKEILCIMNKHLAEIIQNYANKFTLENFKGRTPYQDSDGELTPKSRTGS